MKIRLKYGDKEILGYDTEYDTGFGHLMVVLACLFDTVAAQQPDYINVEVNYQKK